jgi:hypothetical protein
VRPWSPPRPAAAHSSARDHAWRARREAPRCSLVATRQGSSRHRYLTPDPAAWYPRAAERLATRGTGGGKAPLPKCGSKDRKFMRTGNARRRGQSHRVPGGRGSLRPEGGEAMPSERAGSPTRWPAWGDRAAGSRRRRGAPRRQALSGRSRRRRERSGRAKPPTGQIRNHDAVEETRYRSQPAGQEKREVTPGQTEKPQPSCKQKATAPSQRGQRCGERLHLPARPRVRRSSSCSSVGCIVAGQVETVPW